jgi:hypothetical protein
VPPPAALAPDSIAPVLASGDQPGGYNLYGPRVPAVVVSGYAKPHAVTNVVHDHTSILTTIEAKWNLPSMTYRDANAATLADFLQATPSFPEPPTLAVPSNIIKSEVDCNADDPPFTQAPQQTAVRRASAKLSMRFYGRRERSERYLVALRLSTGTVSDLEVQLGDGSRVLARGHAEKVSTHTVHVMLTPVGKRHVAAGRYDLRVVQGRRALYRGRVKVTA